MVHLVMQSRGGNAGGGQPGWIPEMGSIAGETDPNAYIISLTQSKLENTWEEAFTQPEWTDPYTDSTGLKPLFIIDSHIFLIFFCWNR